MTTHLLRYYYTQHAISCARRGISQTMINILCMHPYSSHSICLSKPWLSAPALAQWSQTKTVNLAVFQVALPSPCPTLLPILTLAVWWRQCCVKHRSPFPQPSNSSHCLHCKTKITDSECYENASLHSLVNTIKF